MSKPSPSLVNLDVFTSHKPGCYGSTTATARLSDRYILHIHGRRGLVRVPGRDTLLDTGCSYLALPHRWWHEWGIELHSPEEEHAVVVRGNRVNVIAGESRVQICERIPGGDWHLSWPPAQGCITARTCLVPKLQDSSGHRGKKTSARKDDAKVLIGLGLFAGMRLCMHLDGSEPRAAVFADVEEGNCFQHFDD